MHESSSSTKSQINPQNRMETSHHTQCNRPLQSHARERSLTNKKQTRRRLKQPQNSRSSSSMDTCETGPKRLRKQIAFTPGQFIWKSNDPVCTDQMRTVASLDPVISKLHTIHEVQFTMTRNSDVRLKIKERTAASCLNECTKSP